VVPEHDLRGAGLDHRAGDAHRVTLLDATIDQVAHEHHLPTGLAPGSVALSIAEASKQPDQLVGTPVHVADDVVTAQGSTTIFSVGVVIDFSSSRPALAPCH